MVSWDRFGICISAGIGIGILFFLNLTGKPGKAGRIYPLFKQEKHGAGEFFCERHYGLSGALVLVDSSIVIH